MTNKLEVSFNSPQCGWMSIGFGDGAAGISHDDRARAAQKALPELLEILTELLDANSENGERVLHWNRNPEEFDFRFARDGGNLTLEIYQYPSERRKSDERERVFAHAGTVGEVCRAFAETFRQLYADRDTDEFEFHWRQEFPLAEYEKFNEALAANL